MKHIKCKTKKQMRKVLKKLENDGYRWSSGTKPTEYVPFDSYKENTVIEVDDECRKLAYASYGFFTERNVKVFIDAEDFVRDEKNRPSIVIFRRDRNVIAKDIVTGNEGVAKCSPDDEFVFKTGASIALARLMAKTPEVLTDDVKTEWKRVLGIKGSEKKVYTDGGVHEGDTVRVVNTGLNYSSYPQWVGKYISDPYMAARYCYGSPNTEKKYKVIKIAEHESNGRTLAFIEECDGFIHNRCYLIEVKGLEKA